MFESGKKGNAAKKAYEIAYALFRVSAKISESSVKDNLESRAIDLLVAANTESFDHAAKVIAAIEALVKFAIDLNIISIANGDVLLREIAVLNEIVIERLDRSDDIDVSRFFSKNKDAVMSDVVHTPPFVISREPVSSAAPAARPVVQKPLAVPTQKVNFSAAPAVRNETVQVPVSVGAQNFMPAIEKQSFVASTISSNFGEGEGPTKNSEQDFSETDNSSYRAPKSGNRQIAILDKIRQSGNCKLREIQEILPDCSERTIRYDLEELIERNLVERIGAGGPAVSYRIRQMV